MENDAAIPSIEEQDDCEEVSQLANEDAVRVGNMLLPYLLTIMLSESRDPPFIFSDCPVGAEEDHEVALKALAKLKDTWKYLQGEMSCAVDTLVSTIHACCQLHNTVMDMEDDAVMPGVEEPDYCGEVRQLENEDAVRVRNMLSQYFPASKSSKSGVGTVDAEEGHEIAASGSGDEDKEQEAHTRTSEEEIIN